jgi:outer membrane cobalamin receptor
MRCRTPFHFCFGVIFFLQLTLPAPAFAAGLRGTVTDPDGRPVPGARIIITSSRPDTVELDTTADGTYEAMHIPAGEYVVRVVLDGFVAEAARVQISGATPVEVPLRLRIGAVTESLVVSGAHTDLPLSEAASTVTVVSGTEIESRQMRTVDDALRFVPGLAVAHNGGFNNLTSLFTRGGESNFTLVLLDGMRVNAFGGGLDLSQIPLVNVDRVEVVRGPQSAVFGADAIGGVVHVVTKRSQHNRGELLLEGGSLGTIRLRAGGGGSRGGISYHAAVEHAVSDGFTGIAPATGTTVSNDNGTTDHIGFGAGWRSTSGTAVKSSGQFSFTKRGFPGPFGSNPIGVYGGIDTVSRGDNTRRQFGVEWAQPWGAASRMRQRTHVAVAHFDSTFISPFGTSLERSRRVSVRSQTDVALSATVGVSAGVDIQRERADSTFIIGLAGAEVPVSRWLSGYFVEARLAPSARWSLAGGVRVEQIARDALQADPFGFQPRPAFARNTVVSANPRISMALIARGAGTPTTTKLHASAGTGIRPPDAFEIAFTDNPALVPERSRSVDVGLHQTFAGGIAVAEATVFYNNYDDMIVAVGSSFRDASRFRTDNISNARSRGVELAFSARPAARFGIRAAYTCLDTEIRSVDRTEGQAPSPFRVGEALIRRPRHQGSVSATFTERRLTAYIDAVFRGEVRDVEPTFGAFGGVFTAKGYRTANSGATVRVARTVDAFVRVENIGGGRFEEAFGFPSPGRTATVGVRVATGR